MLLVIPIVEDHKPEMSKQVFVGRLSEETKFADIERLFQGYGRIRQITLRHDYAFVELSDPRDAENAVHALDGEWMLGTRVVVNYARSKPTHVNRNGHSYPGRRLTRRRSYTHSRSRSPIRRSHLQDENRRNNEHSTSPSQNPVDLKVKIKQEYETSQEIETAYHLNSFRDFDNVVVKHE
ncbi:putative RNA-binding protein T28D9.2in chromosome II [Aphelenchoides besseyi]|nr:putative RNA-binding protein T28D9.2in chromosome II [Aphelenchoides besseyi]KAI6202582.1 putative RNA-binding protein T28D9.2in chromosome II [Aphelenchoides besseyi]